MRVTTIPSTDFSYGILKEKPILPNGFTLIEHEDCFVMARDATGSMYFCGQSGELHHAILQPSGKYWCGDKFNPEYK